MLFKNNFHSLEFVCDFQRQKISNSILENHFILRPGISVSQTKLGLLQSETVVRPGLAETVSSMEREKERGFREIYEYECFWHVSKVSVSVITKTELVWSMWSGMVLIRG